MTEKLFEQDVLLRQCTATVTDCTPVEGGWLVQLDRTVLFPEGGGQLSDVGSIGEASVSHVRERDGVITNLCDRPLTVGDSVTVTLDRETRLDHMQQHTGEHILSHALWHLWGANNIGFHMSRGQQVTIDMDTELTPEQLIAAEDYANQQIWNNLPVETTLVDSSKLDALPLRKKTDKVEGLLRVVTIQDGDCCTCCGTHLPRTGMVGSIRILRQERYKGGVRIRFLCGRWALENARDNNATVLELGALLSAKPEELTERVTKLKEKAAEAKKLLKAMQQGNN